MKENDRISPEEMTQIFMFEIPLEGLVLDDGIWEFHEDGDKSIGVSYEENDGKVGYVFNLFVSGEYINIAGIYNSIFDAAPVVAKIWNSYESEAW